MGASDVQLTINGDIARYEGPLTVGELVAALGLQPKKLAVELNRAIVPKSAYGHTPLSDGDSLEIVHFVGGG